MSELEPIEDLIARSSLGTPAARAIAARTPDWVVEEVMRRVKTACTACSHPESWHLVGPETWAECDADECECVMYQPKEADMLENESARELHSKVWEDDGVPYCGVCGYATATGPFCGGSDAIDELRGANAEIDYLRHLVEQADRLVAVVLSEWEALSGLASIGASVSGAYDELDEEPSPSLVPAVCEEWKNARAFNVPPVSA